MLSDKPSRGRKRALASGELPLGVARVFVAVGSNVEPAASLAAALRLLAGVARVQALSTVYRTPSFGPREQPDFYNAVLELDTTLTLASLESALHEVERRLGRVRSGDRWAPRTIDLDLLVYVGGDGVVVCPRLSEIHERAFVAVPLAELAPELVLPDGARAIDLAGHVQPWPMEPLAEVTDQLRKDLQDGRGKSSAARARAARRDR